MCNTCIWKSSENTRSAKETLYAFKARCRHSSMRINHFLITKKLAALCQRSDGLSV